MQSIFASNRGSLPENTAAGNRDFRRILPAPKNSVKICQLKNSTTLCNVHKRTEHLLRSYSSAREHVEDLVDPVFGGNAGIVLGGRDEFAFLQNPDGADVVLSHEGMEWPLFDFGDEGGEGSRRNAPAPEVAPDPVADQPLVLGDPASDVPSHLSVADDRADDVRGLTAELGPMCHEGVMIPRGKRRQPHSFRVALMLEEDRKLGVDDLAQKHPWWIAHAESETSKRPRCGTAGASIPSI